MLQEKITAKELMYTTVDGYTALSTLNGLWSRPTLYIFISIWECLPCAFNKYHRYITLFYHLIKGFLKFVSISHTAQIWSTDLTRDREIGELEILSLFILSIAHSTWNLTAAIFLVSATSVADNWWLHCKKGINWDLQYGSKLTSPNYIDRER